MFDAEAAMSVLEPVSASVRVIPLSEARPGQAGVVARVGQGSGGLRGELERRLLEIGFVEGARIAVLHEGLFGRDPIAVRLDDMRVALRRREAAEVLVRLDPAASAAERKTRQ